MRGLDDGVREEVRGHEQSERQREEDLGHLVDVLGQPLAVVVGGQDGGPLQPAEEGECGPALVVVWRAPTPRVVGHRDAGVVAVVVLQHAGLLDLQRGEENHEKDQDKLSWSLTMSQR